MQDNAKLDQKSHILRVNGTHKLEFSFKLDLIPTFIELVCIFVYEVNKSYLT